MAAAMARMRLAIRRGERRMGVVDAEDAASPQDVQTALAMGVSDNGKAVLLWWRDLPERMFSPARRTDAEADKFLTLWNFGEELAIRFNDNIREIEA